jgi:cardiolipin synthase
VLIRTSMLVNRTATRYRRKQYLHAKCIVFYLKNGKRVAITGSHNFVWGGVMLGTREIALQTKSPHVIEQIEDFFHTHVRVGAGTTEAG